LFPVLRKPHFVIVNKDQPVLAIEGEKITVSSKTLSGKIVNIVIVEAGGKYNNNHYAFNFKAEWLLYIPPAVTEMELCDLPTQHIYVFHMILKS
jgi:hypothetical protein